MTRRNAACDKARDADSECPPDVVAAADLPGSTAEMATYIDRHAPTRVVPLTECSMSDNLALQYPALDFVRPGNLCPHMKRITLGNIRQALEQMRHVVEVDPALSLQARAAVERMLAL
ncbi:quinolinate synthase NadA [Roseomonas hellenica]|nr:quinolinate synthase NadA [Plastoroseomonas hellenica]